MPSREAECAERLAELRWGKDWACPRCGGRKRYHLACRPRVFECAGCKAQISVTAGTLLERMRVPLSLWFRAVDLFTRRCGVSARAVARELELPVKTAFALLHRIRKALDVGETCLVGPTDTGTYSVNLRRPPRSAHRTRVFVASDERGQLFMDVGQDAGLASLITHSPDAQPKSEERIALGGPARMAFLFAHIRAKRVHRQVSERWMARYYRADAYLKQRVGDADYGVELPEVAAAVVARCLAAAPCTFRNLQPAFYPNARELLALTPRFGGRGASAATHPVARGHAWG